MDNFSQENDEKEFNQNDSKIEDIQFEDSMDIDKIKEKLIEKIQTGENEDESDDEGVKEFLEQNPENGQPVENLAGGIESSKVDEFQPAQIDTKAKKYVIYVDSDNIDFIEGLSIQERRLTINKILREQNAFTGKAKIKNERLRTLKHVFVACLTFIIAFPVVFYLANSSAEVAITNYRQAKRNFEKLYRKEGKIKPADYENVTDFKY